MGIQSRIKFLHDIMSNDDKMLQICTSYILPFYPDIKITPELLLSSVIQFRNLLNWFANYSKSELTAFVNNALKIINTDRKLTYKYQTLPWYPLLENDRLVTSLPFDTKKLTQAYLSVLQDAFVNVPDKYKDTMRLLDIQINSACLAAWMCLHDIYMAELEKPSLYMYQNLTIIETNSSKNGNECQVGDDDDNDYGSNHKLASKDEEARNVCGHFLQERMDYLISVANDCGNVLSKNMITTKLVDPANNSDNITCTHEIESFKILQ